MANSEINGKNYPYSLIISVWWMLTARIFRTNFNSFKNKDYFKCVCIYTYMYINTNIHVYVCIYIDICVYLCSPNKIKEIDSSYILKANSIRVGPYFPEIFFFSIVFQTWILTFVNGWRWIAYFSVLYFIQLIFLKINLGEDCFDFFIDLALLLIFFNYFSYNTAFVL